MAKLKIVTLALLVAIFSCDNSQNKHTHTIILSDTSITDTGYTGLLAHNLNRIRPGFILILDSLKFDSQKYAAEILPDTSNCSSFKYNRLFLGEVNKTPTVVKANISSANELYLQSGNLSLWVCNLPDKIKSGDTIFITGHIFDNHGNEKSWGFPTILTKVYTRQ